MLEEMAKIGLFDCATVLVRAVGDLTLITFYFLRQVGEYTVRYGGDLSKQTEQFQVRVARFFTKVDNMPHQLPPNAPDDDLLNTDSSKLRLRDQNNGWKNVYINQEANGDPYFCGTRALARRVIYIRKHTDNRTTLLSMYWAEGECRDISDMDIRVSIKTAATTHLYPGKRNIEIGQVDTHSLRGGGANALHLVGHSDRHIKKMGRWKEDTFLEYILEELGSFSVGMSRSMKKTV